MLLVKASSYAVSTIFGYTFSHPESSCCHGAALQFPWQQGTGIQHLHSFMAQNLCVYVSALLQFCVCVLCFQSADTSFEEHSLIILHDAVVDQYHRQTALHCCYEASCVLWYDPTHISQKYVRRMSVTL